MPTVLINDKGIPEQIHEDAVANALSSNYKIPLINAEGNAVSVPLDQARNLVQAGTHSQLEPEQMQHLLDQEHYGSAGQQALSFIEGALNPNTLGAYGKAVEKLGLTTTQDMARRQEFNPGTHLAGEIAGNVAGAALLPETSLPGVIQKAGTAAAKAITKTGMFGKIAQGAVKGAIEGGLLNAQTQITERILGDTSQTAESTAAHIGLGTLLGATGGAAFAPLSRAVERGAEALKKMPANELIEKGTNLVLKTGADKVLAGLGVPGIVREAIKDKIKGAIGDNYTRAALNGLIHISELSAKTTKSMEKHVGGIFSQTTDTILPPDREERSSKPLEMDKTHEYIEAYMQNPMKLLDRMHANNAVLSEIAPELSAGIGETVARGVSFLSTKLPPKDRMAPLDPVPIPNQSQISQFNRYASIVDNPMKVLSHIQQGTLLPQDMEALGAVYPTLYNEMRGMITGKMMDYLSQKDNPPLPTPVRINLSMFLGEPLDSSMIPQNIMSSQMALQGMGIQKAMNEAAQKQSVSKNNIGKMKSPLRELTRSNQVNLDLKRSI